MPIYMQYEGISGSVTASGRPGWIEIMSYSLGAELQTSDGGGGGGAGVVRFSHLTVVQATGKGSPTLLLACCKGRHFPRVQLDFVRRGQGNSEEVYLKYELRNVMVTSYQVGGEGAGSIPTETLSLNFDKITWTQLVPGGTEQMNWDLSSNTGGGGQG